jgi:hypothetical protein
LELHVVFSYSAKAGLREALGPEAAIVRFSDDLSYGPINPPEAVARRAWTDAYLGYDNPDITDDEQLFWPRVLDLDVKRVAWFSRRNAHEYCGFLEYLRRLENLPTNIVDATGSRHSGGEAFRSVATIPAMLLKGVDLLGGQRVLNASEWAGFLSLWDRLRAEAAELRIVADDLSLSSAPLSYFDQELVSLTSESWRPMQLVLADALVRWPVGDIFLMSRLYALSDAGFLDFRDTERRLPDVKRAFS